MAYHSKPAGSMLSYTRNFLPGLRLLKLLTFTASNLYALGQICRNLLETRTCEIFFFNCRDFVIERKRPLRQYFLQILETHSDHSIKGNLILKRQIHNSL